MLFNSYEFIFVFLPLTLVAYFSFIRFRLSKIPIVVLLIASAVFYSYWDIKYLPLLVVSIIFNYFLGVLIGNTHSKRLLFFAVSTDLLILGYYKYTAFFISTINMIFNRSGEVPNIILPLGISFFTFTQIAYLVDAYRGETKKYSFMTYSLFVTFFPHLIAGPILYHKDIIPQFSKLRNYIFSFKNVALGLTLFSIGLFKKVIIADTLAPSVKLIFDHVADLTFVEAWLGALGYTLQLYFDFSGYSEMAIGIGLMLNIKLPTNFNAPYQAKSIIDFWRRWHMTLSAFLKNYLYIPLGGNRHGEMMKLRNLLITMLLGGLWHGAGWTFVIWGGLHGVYLVINHIWRKIGFKIPMPISWLITFICVTIAWVFFRASTLHDAVIMLQSMFCFNGIVLPVEAADKVELLKKVDFITFSEPKVFDNIKNGILIIMALIGITQWEKPQNLLQQFKPKLIWIVIVVVLFLVSIFNLTKESEFLYFQF